MPLGRLHISNRGSFVSHHRRAGKDSYIHQALRFVSTPLAWFYIQLGQASKCGWMLAKISCVRQRDFSYSTTSTHRKGWIRRLATSKSGTGFRGQTERVKHGMMTGAMRAEKGTSSGTNSLVWTTTSSVYRYIHSDITRVVSSVTLKRRGAIYTTERRGWDKQDRNQGAGRRDLCCQHTTVVLLTKTTMQCGWARSHMQHLPIPHWRSKLSQPTTTRRQMRSRWRLQILRP
ncbi:unnamed protein product [Fusarium graminearum]|uniref:Uncharacterized protein n=1 Tax=Gibberella zeae TaxID=5518 RepID=A0A4E9E2F0_GIBZA|nr:unnamed protein product [Fusarium graminearum]CAG2008080.1 unnamed protein product [Fusarium graminearum]